MPETRAAARASALSSTNKVDPGLNANLSCRIFQKRTSSLGVPRSKEETTASKYANRPVWSIFKARVLVWALVTRATLLPQEFQEIFGVRVDLDEVADALLQRRDIQFQLPGPEVDVGPVEAALLP